MVYKDELVHRSVSMIRSYQILCVLYLVAYWQPHNKHMYTCKYGPKQQINYHNNATCTVNILLKQTKVLWVHIN